MSRTNISSVRDIPNIGPATEKILYTIGINEPCELIGKDPYQMYKDLCRITNTRHDPCVLDVFISAVRYMEGGPAKKWWEFTEERKQHFNKLSKQ